MQIQVRPDVYFNKGYDDESRFIGYWHQIRSIQGVGIKTILEVGIGNGLVSDYLKKRGNAVYSLDFDRRIGPDVEGDVRALPFKESAFDVVVAFEVLEHIPNEMFEQAIMELARVSKKRVIISLPDVSRNFLVSLRIFGFCNKQWELPFPSRLRQEVHRFEGEHYWEIGKKGFELEIIKARIEKTGVKLISTFRPFNAPCFRFFTFEKSEPQMIP